MPGITKPARRRLEIECLEARLPTNCPLGQDWTFDLDHGAHPNNVYASEGWHESVINLTLPDESCEVTSIAWSVPSLPVIFKAYIHTKTEGKLVPFVAPAPGDKIFGIGVFWGPVDQTVSISATVTLDNGESKTKTATFDIDEPELVNAQITIQRGPLIVEDPPGSGEFQLGAAIGYEATVHADHQGEFFWIHLVQHYGAAIFQDNQQCTADSQGWRLDGASDDQGRYPATLPDGSTAFAVHTDDDGNATIRFVDFPGPELDFPTGNNVLLARHMEYTFDGQLWLMYESHEGDGAQPVPVAKAETHFFGAAILQAGEDGKQATDWTIHPSSHLYVNPMVVSDTWPEWQGHSYEQPYNWECA
jgi:hypothetical protein